VICQSDAYLREDFSATNTLLANIVDYYHSSQNPSPMVTLIQQCTTQAEQELLLRITRECILSGTLLPIYSVGVQVTQRHYTLGNISTLCVWTTELGLL